MACYEIDGLRPVIHPGAFVHPMAVLIGDVVVEAGCYIAPLASLRGDFGRIVLKKGSNLQDTCVIHGFPGSETVIEEEGHIGHGAVLHGCRIGRNALIGMNAVVMDEAAIGESSIVAAGAFIKAGMEVPARHLAVGVPAKVLRPLSEEEMAWKKDGTQAYQRLAVRCAATMRECDPLAEEEPHRRRLEASDVVPLITLKQKAK